MKAILYEGVKKVNVHNVADPKLEKSDDIIIKVTSTAICGSDLHLIHGMIPNLKKNSILGHETMGIVEEVGNDVTKLKKGDRVVIPFPISCGHCFYCKHKLYSQCDNSNKYTSYGGLFGYSDTFGGYDGGQAEYLRVPYANVGPIKIPEELSDDQVLFLTDVLPTSYWGVDNAGVKSNDTVVVLGCGPIGLSVIKWLIFKNVKRIIAVDNIPYRLNHAASYKGIEIINFEDYDDTGKYINEITHGGADVVIDCVGMDGTMTNFEKLETKLKLQGGSKSAIEISSQAVRKCGTVMMVGVYGGKYNMFPLGEFFSKNITLKMGQCPAQAYMPKILDIIQKGEYNPTDIITHKISLDDGKHAYDIFDNKLDNCIKVVLKP